MSDWAGAGLTGGRYLLAVLVLAVLSTLPMVAVIGAGMAALEPWTPGTTVVRPFLTPGVDRPVTAPARPGAQLGSDELTPDQLAPDQLGVEAAGPGRTAAELDRVARCAAKSGDLATSCHHAR